ncbi:MAG: hypothetical protein NZ699_15600 [Roseiflexus sp.]|nr:hypothetical protein [Roseiflexus sp.]MDW8148217.1 hypothetical protein [Roseiflexaceae bacterium]
MRNNPVSPDLARAGGLRNRSLRLQAPGAARMPEYFQLWHSALAEPVEASAKRETSDERPVLREPL